MKHRTSSLNGFLLSLLLGISSLFAAVEAAAQTRCTNQDGPISISLPSSITVPRDTPVGTRISQWTSSSVSNYICRNVPANRWVGAGVGSTLANTGQTFTIDGSSYPVYRTSLAGVGMIAAKTNSARAIPASPTMLLSFGEQSSGNNVTTGSMPARLRVALVKIAAIEGGLVNGGRFGTAGAGQERVPDADDDNFDFSQAQVAINFSSVNIIVGTCATPDVSVNLGSYKSSEFTGVGSSTRNRDFSVSMRNCSTSIQRMTIRLDPTTSILNKDQSVIALDGKSGAKGIGIKLMGNDGKAIKLNEVLNVPAYKAGAGGNVDFPMQAAFYQTEKTVSPGKASSSVMFTMSYQ
ncbi:fimbrial protein [Herbaspirillum lusitanum]|uniref:Fimbrial protein n=1 Tax=Herbaspirillum lusitanum TaxID=213312 RepID=A0ABW9AGE6_9BURK